jgi:small redox-active disulfide protein 2
MKIEILGPGCIRCMTTERNVREALAGLGRKARIVHIHEDKDFAKFGIKFTPAVVVDGEIRSSGRVPEVREIRRWLKESAGGMARRAAARR